MYVVGNEILNASYPRLRSVTVTLIVALAGNSEYNCGSVSRSGGVRRRHGARRAAAAGGGAGAGRVGALGVAWCAARRRGGRGRALRGAARGGPRPAPHLHRRGAAIRHHADARHAGRAS